MGSARELVIEVEEVRGRCPVYKRGDKMVFRRGYDLDLDRSDALCTHALSAMVPFLASLARGISPGELGLSKGGQDAFVQCPDPGEPCTSGGTVIFRIRAEG